MKYIIVGYLVCDMVLMGVTTVVVVMIGVLEGGICLSDWLMGPVETVRISDWFSSNTSNNRRNRRRSFDVFTSNSFSCILRNSERNVIFV